MLLSNTSDDEAPTFEQLIELLARGSIDDQRDAAKQLGRLADARAIAPLVSSLQTADWKVGKLALRSLKSIDTEDSREELLKALEYEDARVRHEIVLWLEQLMDSDPRERLAQCLDDPEPRVRKAAVSALANLGKRKAKKPLAQALGHALADVRSNAALALGQFGDARAGEELKHILLDPASADRLQAARLLVQLDPTSAVEPMLAVASDPETSAGLRRHLAKSLDELDDARIADFFAASLGDTDKQLRQIAALALGRRGHRSAVEGLIDLISDVELASMKKYVPLGLLEKLEEPSAIERLRPVAADPSQPEKIRERCLKVIEKLESTLGTDSPAVDQPDPETPSTVQILRSQEKTIENPQFSDVDLLVTDTAEWDLIELAFETQGGVIASQLVLIVEPEHGVLARYTSGQAEDEWVFVGDTVRDESEEVETFDGGDEWVVPAHYFSLWSLVAPLTRTFLETGQLDPSDGWIILGMS